MTPSWLKSTTSWYILPIGWLYIYIYHLPPIKGTQKQPSPLLTSLPASSCRTPRNLGRRKITLVEPWTMGGDVPTKPNWAMKKGPPGWLGYIGDDKLLSVDRDFLINHHKKPLKIGLKSPKRESHLEFFFPTQSFFWGVQVVCFREDTWYLILFVSTSSMRMNNHAGTCGWDYVQWRNEISK